MSNSYPEPHPTREILIVDGDAALRDEEQLSLSGAGCHVTVFADGTSALNVAAFRHFDLIVIDSAIPDINGFDLCRRLRAAGANQGTLILMLSSTGRSADAVEALESGADDCLMKPFDERELLARVSALFRRADRLRDAAGPPASRRIEMHDVVIDADRRLCIARGETLELTKQEFDLLYLLATRPGVVFTREALVAALSGRGAPVSTRTVDSVVSRLRAKIERDPDAPELILTVWGSGYQFTRGA